MRDPETIGTAMKAAETGHLVISTLDTPDAVTTVNRIVAMFPAAEQEMARMRLAETLQAGGSQQLLPPGDRHRRGAGGGNPIFTRPGRGLIKEPDPAPPPP